MIISKLLGFGLGLVVGIVATVIIIYFTALQCTVKTSSSSGSGSVLTGTEQKQLETIKIAVVNNSNKSLDEVQKVVDAVQMQVSEDFAPIWDIDATLEIFSDLNQIPEPYWLCLLYEDTDQEQALGYHTLDNNGEPIMKVFVKTVEQYGIPWSLTLSHEILETIADPWAAACVFLQNPEDATNGIILSMEVSDPCQDQSHGYLKNGVLVSDFVTPAWFSFYQSQGPFDFCKHMTDPLSILPGGYALLFSIPSEDGQWQTLTAEQVPQEEESQYEPQSQRTQMIRASVPNSDKGRQMGDETPILVCERARSVLITGKKFASLNAKHPKLKH